MHNVFTLFMEAKCVADKVKPPDEIGLKLSHKTFAFFKYFGNVPDN